MKRPIDLQRVRNARAILDVVDASFPEAYRGGMSREKWLAIMNEQLNVGVRLPAALVARIDACAAQLRAENPGATFTRSDAIRVLLRKALDAERGEYGDEGFDRSLVAARDGVAVVEGSPVG